jgi:hypothetical protein
VKPSLDEETLYAFESLLSMLEDRQWTKGYDSTYYESYEYCQECRASFSYRFDRDKEKVHEPNCDLKKKMELFSAFLRIERQLLEEQERDES